MNIAEVSVKRPVFAIMMTAALIVLGAVSYESLGLDLMPKTDAPVVSVQANLPGASAEEIETTITKRIEEAVNTISGIDELRASSDQGNSRVTITFTLERDIESATQDVRDKLAQIVSQFPRDTRPLQITKMDPDAQPIFGFAVFGPRRRQGADRDRREARQAGARDRQGRRIGRLQRRTEARDPAPAQRRSPQRLRPHGRSGPHRGRTAERRDSRRSVHCRPGRRRAADDGPNQERRGLQPHRDLLPRRRIGHHLRRRGTGAGHDAGGAKRDTSQRYARHRRAGSQAVGHEHRRGRRSRPGAAAAHPGAAAPGHPDQHRQRPVPIHPPLVRGHQAAPDPRRPSRQRRGVPVHPEPARHVHRRARDPDLDHRHLHVHEDCRLHPEQHDDAGALAGDRHRHRRRDCRPREHLPVRRGKACHAEGSGCRRDEGNRAGGHGDDALARRDLRAGGVHDRPDRPLLLQLRIDVGRRDPAVDVRLVHAHAGALRDVAETGRCEVGTLDDEVVGGLRRYRSHLRKDAGMVARSSRDDDWHCGGRRPLGGLPVSLRRQGARARRRPGRVQHQRASAARHQLPADRRIHPADREGRAGAFPRFSASCRT